MYPPSLQKLSGSLPVASLTLSFSYTASPHSKPSVRNPTTSQTIFEYPPVAFLLLRWQACSLFRPRWCDLFCVHGPYTHIFFPPAACPARLQGMQCLPDELNCLWIHGVRRLGLHGALFHSISTLDEWQGYFCVVQSLPKLFHLIKRVNTVPSSRRAFQTALSQNLYALFEKLDFKVPNACEWNPEKNRNKVIPSLVIFTDSCWFRASAWMVKQSYAKSISQSELHRTS